MKNVLIVSAWGRGSAMAYQLKRQGYSVMFVDMSPGLSVDSSEREGPFGVFMPEGLSALHKKILCGDSYFPVSKGFCSFTPQGPVESFGNLKFLPKKKQDFFLDLIRQWTNSYTSFEHREWNLCQSEYYFRENSHAYLQEIREYLQAIGVQWLSINSSEQINISIQKNHVYVDVEGVKKKSILVWALGGLESQKVFPKYFDLLFPDWKEPLYIWRRFFLQWDPGKFQTILPCLLAVLPDADESFKFQEGMMSIKKHPFSSNTDLWILCSYQQSIDKAYLSNLVSSTKNKLHSLFPFSSIKISFDHQKKYQNYFVLYQEDIIREKLSFKKTLPIMHLNPESCGKMDSYSLMMHSMQMADFLEKI